MTKPDEPREIFQYLSVEPGLPDEQITDLLNEHSADGYYLKSNNEPLTKFLFSHICRPACKYHQADEELSTGVYL